MRAWLLIAALLAGCDSITETVVIVDGDAVFQSVRITVTNPNIDPAPIFSSTDLPLCNAGQRPGCYDLPLSVTLVPGAHSPDETVRVQVDAVDPAGSQSDAAVFKFAHDERRALRFSLRSACRGTRCAGMDQACGADGTCKPSETVPLASLDGGLPVPNDASSAMPDAASSMPDASMSAGVQRLGEVHEASNAMVVNPTQNAFVNLVEGDVVIAAVSLYDLSMRAPMPPATGGWIQVGTTQYLNGRYGGVWYRIIGPNESWDPLVYTFTTTGGTNATWHSWALVYRGAKVKSANVDYNTCKICQFMPTPVVTANITVVGLMQEADPINCTPDSPIADYRSQVGLVWSTFEYTHPSGVLTAPLILEGGTAQPVGMYWLELEPR